jgi:hypothetical protein
LFGGTEKSDAFQGGTFGPTSTTTFWLHRIGCRKRENLDGIFRRYQLMLNRMLTAAASVATPAIDFWDKTMALLKVYRDASRTDD